MGVGTLPPTQGGKEHSFQCDGLTLFPKIPKLGHLKIFPFKVVNYSMKPGLSPLKSTVKYTRTYSY